MTVPLKRSKQQGLAAVEFIITIPTILLILIAITEVGNAFIRYNTLNKMVQNGIRYATTDITGTSSYDQIADVDKIKNIVVYGSTTVGDGATAIIDGLSTSDVSVTHASGYVTVTVNHSYAPMMGTFSSDVNFAFPLNASAMMRTAP